MFTFVQLIKNPIFKFWEFQFTKSTPEIQRLFVSVYKSCELSSQ